MSEAEPDFRVAAAEMKGDLCLGRTQNAHPAASGHVFTVTHFSP